MSLRRAILLVMLGISFLQGCSKSAPAGSTTPQANQLGLSEKAKVVEERIVNGETANESDLEGLSSIELRILRNASFARHGRKYDSPGLGDYFGARSWYTPRDDYNDKLLTATDRANVKVILAAEQRASTNTVASADSSTAERNPPPPPVQPVPQSVGIGGGQLTTENVQSAVDRLLDWTRKGGRAIVLGIQEAPQENSAKADIQFDGFQYNANYLGSPVSKEKKNPPIPTSINDPKYREKRLALGNPSALVKVRSFSGRGVGVLKHYNDGRWVLTSVSFDWVGVTGNVEIR